MARSEPLDINIEKDAYYDYEGDDYQEYSYAYTYPPECKSVIFPCGLFKIINNN